MNPDTDPIAEVEAWLVGKMYPYPACLTERIGPTIDAALACLPASSCSSVQRPKLPPVDR